MKWKKNIAKNYIIASYYIFMRIEFIIFIIRVINGICTI